MFTKKNPKKPIWILQWQRWKKVPVKNIVRNERCMNLHKPESIYMYEGSNYFCFNLCLNSILNALLHTMRNLVIASRHKERNIHLHNIAFVVCNSFKVVKKCRYCYVHRRKMHGLTFKTSHTINSKLVNQVSVRSLI